jgi:hypothetical protein
VSEVGSSQSPLIKVLERLEGVKAAGNRAFMAKCPAHEDRRQSLSLAEGEGGCALLHCHAGCAVADILEALGLLESDLFPPRETPVRGNGRPKEDVWTPNGPALAKYEYTDETGKLLYVVCRTGEKGFPVYVPDPSAPHGKRWSLKDTRRVLYRLPAIIEAVGKGLVVYLCEGEKDVHALVSWGLCATTSPGGASKSSERPKWRDEYSEALKGATVVLLPDNDESGRAHMAAAAASLTKAGATPLTIDLASDWTAMPDKGDVSDWIAHGGFREYLEGLIADARKALAPTPNAGPFIDWSTFWDRDYNAAEWIYPDVLARGRGHALYATHKTGKSLLMLYVAAQIATGDDPAVVIYLDYEMTEADLFDRLDNMGYGAASDLSRLRYALLPVLPPLDTEQGADALTAIVDGVQGEYPEHHLVVIIDTISRAVCGEENSADTFRAFYNHTGIRLKQRGITWARLDHAGKDPMRSQRGSSSKGDDVDVVWKLTATESGVCLYRDVARMPWVPDKVQFGLSECPLTYTRLAGDWPAHTGELANILDRLDVPMGATVRDARAALKKADEAWRTNVVTAALRWRREQTSFEAGNRDGKQRETLPGGDF